MFGVSAYAGRALTMSDDESGAPPAAMMSYRVWQQTYGLDPSVIGGEFNINGKPFTIVGVTPPGFFGDTLKSMPPDFFLPLATEPLIYGDSSILKHADAAWLEIIGRIQPGADVRSIEAQMQVELHQWLRSHLSELYADAALDIPKQVLHLSPGGAGITSMRDAVRVRDDDARPVIRFGFQERLQRVLVLRAHSHASDVHVPVSHAGRGSVDSQHPSLVFLATQRGANQSSIGSNQRSFCCGK